MHRDRADPGPPADRVRNGIHVADKWSLGYYTHVNGYNIENPMTADRFAITFHQDAERRTLSQTLPLVQLARSLWSFLRVAPLIDIAPNRYIGESAVDDTMMIDPAADPPSDESPGATAV